MCCINHGVFKVSRDEHGRVIQKSPLVSLRRAQGLAEKIAFNLGIQQLPVDRKLLSLLQEYLDLHSLSNPELNSHLSILQQSADKNLFLPEARQSAAHACNLLRSMEYQMRQTLKRPDKTP